MSGTKLLLLGSPYLEQDDAVTEVNRRKALALMAYLAVPRQSHSRSTLATLLWPDMDDSRSRTMLRRVLSDLNKTLGGSWSQIHEDTVALNPGVSFWIDVEQFHERLASCQKHGHPPQEVCQDCLPALSSAVELYRDDFMAGFSLPDCPEFDEWQFFQTEHLRERIVSALTRLVDGYRRYGDPDSAIEHARRLLTFEPWHETTHRALMELYHESGRQTAALRQYEEARRILAEELDVPPSPETTLLYERIAADRMAPIGYAVPAGPPAAEDVNGTPRSTRLDEIVGKPRRNHNLPAQTTTFVGRQADLSYLNGLLQEDDTRLITILAPGGMGKTRLAWEVAHGQLTVFPDGVWFVELAPAKTPEQMIATFVSALGLEFHDNSNVLQSLLQYLKSSRMLIVLDNFEHLLPSASLITDMLHVAPGLKILVTSQERLNLRAETVYPIRGLDITPENEIDAAQPSAAAELFLHAARRVRADFQLTSDNLREVTWICRAVEGMPLAIALAAAWIEVLTPAEIGEEIVRSLDFLSAELGDLPRRQWSMRAVFETAWQRLSECEQETFVKLSIFRGGFTRAAAQAVAGADISILRSLMNRSLVSSDAEGRHHVHEVLRGFAQEQLEKTGQYVAIAQAHAQYYLSLAEEGNLALVGPEQGAWTKRLEAERDNFRCVFEWSLSGADVELGAHLAGALALFWRRRAFYLEATSIGERALKLLPEKSAEARLALYLMLGSIYEPLAQYERSIIQLETALRIATSLNDARSAAFAQHGLSRVAWRQGRYADADKYAVDSLQAAEAIEDPRSIARSLHQLGLLASHQGRYACAEQYFRRSLALNEQIGNQMGIAKTLVELGWTMSSQGDYDGANDHLKRSLAISEALGFRMDIAASLNTFGWTAEAQGNDAGAIDYYSRALAIYSAIGLRTGLANTLVNVAFVRLRQNDVDTAYQDLREALLVAHSNGDLPVISEVLAGFAQYYYQIDQIDRSIQVAALDSLAAAMNDQVRKTRLEPLLAKFKQSLPQNELAAALASAQSRNMNETIEELLSQD